MDQQGVKELEVPAPHRSDTVTAMATPNRAHRYLPWRLRQQLRRLRAHPRAVGHSSGVKEWSDREVARLQPGRVKAFLRRHMAQCICLTCLYLGALAFLGASFERYWHWVQTTEAVASEPVKKVNRWTAYCRVQPWTQACRPIPSTGHREVSLGASATQAIWAGDRARLENGRGYTNDFRAAIVGPPSLR